MLTDGVPVEYSNAEGRIVSDSVRLIDFDDPTDNDRLVVNQFTVIENKRNRRPDVVAFVNGLPLAVVELKNPADEEATIRKAFDQFQTCKQDIPSLFAFKEMLVVSDGLEARHGSLTADWDRFMPWRTIDGTDVAPASVPQLDVLTQGVFDKRRFLDLVRFFIVFEDDGKTIAKKLAAYHWPAPRNLIQSAGESLDADFHSRLRWSASRF
jgi:type I restriction enzyme R subunit